MKPLSDKTLSDYELLDEFGSGAVGTVYRARGTRGPLAGKLVTVKKIHDRYRERRPIGAGARSRGCNGRPRPQRL